MTAKTTLITGSSRGTGRETPLAITEQAFARFLAADDAEASSTP
jgi:hypothetical protein